MQLQNIERDLRRAQQSGVRQTLRPQNTYVQTKYRWIILTLATMMMFLNGLLNNIILPLQTKLATIYSVSNKVVNLANILSFAVFLAANLPANQILDQRGIKFGFVLGSSLYLLGILLCCFINVGFPFVIVGYLFFVMGQPFITNIPAKIASYWFFPQNRALATSIMVGTSMIGSGVGFAIPTFVVKEDSEGEEAKRQIFSLYLGYTIITFIMLAGNCILMKSRPQVPPSKINTKQELTIKQIFTKIKKDKNLWKFFASYSFFYGTFFIFAASANFLIKPFGFSDLAISLGAVALIVVGAVGAVLSSVFIKKTKNYGLLIKVLTFSASGGLVLMLLQLFTLPKAGITIIILGVIGFFVVPVVPITYQIGCQVAFPIGQAQVTGILNGGAVIWAFIMDSLLTAIIGFGSKTKSAIFVIVLIAFLILGSLLYSMTEIILKRKQFQEEVESSPQTSKEASESIQKNEASQPIEQKPVQIQMAITPMVIQVENMTESESKKKQDYQNLNEESI